MASSAVRTKKRASSGKRLPNEFYIRFYCSVDTQHLVDSRGGVPLPS